MSSRAWTVLAVMTSSEQQIAASVLVIGTGGSGLRAAIELAERGSRRAGRREAARSRRAHLARRGRHQCRTGDHGCRRQLAAARGRHAQGELSARRSRARYRWSPRVRHEAIEDLERYGMPFAREQDGRISQRFFGAHTYRRTAFAGDYTGLEIQRTLVNRAGATRRSPILDSVYITRLLVRDNVIFGAYGFDLLDGTRYTIHADAVILAAGATPDLAAHVLAPRREHRRLFPSGRGGRRLDPRSGACAVPPVRPDRARGRRRAPWSPRRPAARAGSCATASANAS